jgi:threonyl-tRNA synthetase
MPTITLPNGDKKNFDKPVSAAEVAASIGAGLAKAAIGAKIDFGDGQGPVLRDLGALIDRDASIAIVTAPKPGQAASADALYLMRHSAAHVMAEAIQDVDRQGRQLAYGPPTDTGFFYDMFVPEGKKLSSEHFDGINKRMAEIIAGESAVHPLRGRVRRGAAEAQGREQVQGRQRRAGAGPAVTGLQRPEGSRRGRWGEAAKARVDSRSTPPASPGKNWEDLCRGPHVPSTGRIGAAKVMSLASSYWHGDENSDRLIRVYGTAFATQADLDEFLKQKEEAAKRDHRVIGKALRLFHIDETWARG